MQLLDLVEASKQVAATRSRLEKRSILSRCLRVAAPHEVRLAVGFLSGALRQGKFGLGFATVRRLAEREPAGTATLTLHDVDAAFERVAATRGKGSQNARHEALATLLARATAAERDFLVRLILGELRQGALEGLLVDAVADAAGLDVVEVQRATMLAGDIASVAEAVFERGRAGLARFRLAPLAPIQPMLAQAAAGTGEAIAALGEAAFEYKLDGARVQIHKVESDVRIFSRQLNDVTGRLPEIVRAAREWPARSLIVDGEVIALRGDGRPYPFQVTMSRFGRKSDVAEMSERLPLSLCLFDCLHSDGADLIDRSGAERFHNLAAATEPELLVPRITTADPGTAAEFLGEALARGHEGVMAKSLVGTYQAGNRGGDWLKVKPAHTLDLVVLAAEWGSGRRSGWLSNLHLGARDPATGGFVMLGKTFKGLTDEMLAWQTQKLLALEIGREGHVVHVRPELVVEIAVNQIQTSPHYPAQMALRFARVKRYREDKRAEDADTIAAVRDLHARQT